MDFHQPVEVSCANGPSRTRSVSPHEDPTAAQAPTSSSTELPKDLPLPHLRERLIDSYFSHFHAYFPILDKSSFSSSLVEGSTSITLLRAVLFVGSTQCDPAIYHLLGYSTRNDAGDELFALAKNSFDSDNTSDRTEMLQSCFLLHYWWGQPTAFKDSLWWISTAIRSAQCMGMHRSTIRSKISRNTQVLWKRIWWCLYVSSCQHSRDLKLTNKDSRSAVGIGDWGTNGYQRPRLRCGGFDPGRFSRRVFRNGKICYWADRFEPRSIKNVLLPLFSSTTPSEC